MVPESVPGLMRDAAAFDDALFLGLSRRAKRDPYRLALFAQHFEGDERGLLLLAIQGGTLVVTDRRILEFRAHLEVHGAWNVKEFQGYEVRRQVPRQSVQRMEHAIVAASEEGRSVEEILRLEMDDRAETIVVSRGPEPTLSQEDFEVLRSTILDQAK